MPAAAGLSSAEKATVTSSTAAITLLSYVGLFTGLILLTVGSNSRCKKQKAPEQSQCSDLLFSHKSCCQGDTCRHTDIACIPVVVTDGGQQLGPVPFSIPRKVPSTSMSRRFNSPISVTIPAVIPAIHQILLLPS